MKTYTCYRCGQPIIFRQHRKDPDTKQLVCSRGKPFPIHIHGGCGQMGFPFAA